MALPQDPSTDEQAAFAPQIELLQRAHECIKRCEECEEARIGLSILVPGSPHAVADRAEKLALILIPGLPHVFSHRVETGPVFVPGSPHAVADRAEKLALVSYQD